MPTINRQSLQSVDDITRAVVGCLEEHGAMDRTYFIFTSDHGLHLGQHAMGAQKRMP